MSSERPVDPRLDQAAASDDSLQAAHEKILAARPDTKGNYSLLPLILLFAFSGLIFFAGTYIIRYSGHFSPTVFDPRQLPASGEPVVAKIDPLVLGKRQYNLACITCHQANGQGLPNVYPPLAGSEWVTGSEERVISIVLHGLKGPITVKGQKYDGTIMPAFTTVPGGGYNWSDEKIAAVITYVRHEWGNNAPPVDTARVTELRIKEANRKEWTEAELLELP